MQALQVREGSQQVRVAYYEVRSATAVESPYLCLGSAAGCDVECLSILICRSTMTRCTICSTNTHSGLAAGHHCA